MTAIISMNTQDGKEVSQLLKRLFFQIMELMLIRGIIMNWFKSLQIIKTIVPAITIVINMMKIQNPKIKKSVISKIIYLMDSSINSFQKYFNRKKTNRMLLINKKKKRFSNQQEINLTIIQNYLKNYEQRIKKTFVSINQLLKFNQLS